MGFAFCGVLFFAWFSNQKSTVEKNGTNKAKVLKASAASGYTSGKGSNETMSFNSSDYSGPNYEKSSIPDIEDPGTAKAFRSEKPEGVGGVHATVVRSWKGVHRDVPFATLINDRFKKKVLELSDEYGLYPEVFMARIVAYSYDYVLSPERDPIDKNYTAMKRPNGDDRARFESVEESLKAYAVVNAGEITRLSPAGAIAKHERSWTMQKIIENNNFISNLAAKLRSTNTYAGMIGKSNKVSEEENEKREMIGEAISMVSKIEDKVKKQQAKSAGFDNWEDYVDELTEEEKDMQEKGATEKIAAVSKKKALHLKRRVAAKKN